MRTSRDNMSVTDPSRILENDKRVDLRILRPSLFDTLVSSARAGARRVKIPGWLPIAHCLPVQG